MKHVFDSDYYLSRRQFNYCLVSAVVSLVNPQQGEGHSGGITRPNVIVVITDDLGYGDLGCYGQKIIKTPNIDRLAAEGVRFAQYYAPATVCAPSRASFLTGRRIGNSTVKGNNDRYLYDGETLGTIFKAAGYSTGYLGKWGVGAVPPVDAPARCGFDYFYGYVDMSHAHNCFPEFLIKNGSRVRLGNVISEDAKLRFGSTGMGVASKKKDYAPLLIQNETLKFIRKNKNNPFFIVYAPNMPHANNEAGSAGMEVPSYGRYDSESWPAPEKGFAAMMDTIDKYTGEIVDLLSELKVRDNTIIVFTSDNGPHEEGGHAASFFNSSGGLRGHKRDLYEGGIRVPLIVNWHGKLSPLVSDHLCGGQDIMATLAELAQINCPDNDGISIVPALRGNNQRGHEYLYWEFDEGHRTQALRKGNWKAVRSNIVDIENSPIELFDLSADVAEKKDVSLSNPKIAMELSEIMKNELKLKKQ